MAGRKKSEWKVTLDDLESKLPEKFDGREFRKCRNEDESFDKTKVVRICEVRGFKDKADAVFAFLNHRDTKPAAKPRGAGKKGKGKQKRNAEFEPIASRLFLLPSKTEYKNLTTTQLEKFIQLLVSLHKAKKEKEIAEIDAQMAELAKKKELCQKSNVSISGV